MQYKVLALDLDGTLTNNAKVITPRTKAALQAAADRGVRIVLASGRPTVGIEPLAKELELDRRGGCILSYNGGKIIDCKTGETLVQHEFPPELIDPVCTFARYWNVMPLTYDAKGIVTEDAANPYVGEEARINKIPARQVENLPAEIQWPINKLLLVGDPVDMPHVEELMQQKFAGKLSIYRSAPFFIETMPLGVEKSASLALLQTLLSGLLRGLGGISNSLSRNIRRLGDDDGLLSLSLPFRRLACLATLLRTRSHLLRHTLARTDLCGRFVPAPAACARKPKRRLPTAAVPVEAHRYGRGTAAEDER